MFLLVSLELQDKNANFKSIKKSANLVCKLIKQKSSQLDTEAERKSGNTICFPIDGQAY